VGVTGIFVRLLPPIPPLAVTAGRLLGALVVALPILATSDAERSGIKEALKNPVGYVLASLLTGYYLLATAVFQLAPDPFQATPPHILLVCRCRGG